MVNDGGHGGSSPEDVSLSSPNHIPDIQNINIRGRQTYNSKDFDVGKACRRQESLGHVTEGFVRNHKVFVWYFSFCRDAVPDELALGSSLVPGRRGMITCFGVIYV